MRTAFCDDVDDCVGELDALGVCNGDCTSDVDQDGICDTPGYVPTTPCVDGFAGIYPCDQVDFMSHLTTSEVGGGEMNDIWGWTDPLDGKEYALLGRTSGTAFIDITDPNNPRVFGQPTHPYGELLLEGHQSVCRPRFHCLRGFRSRHASV